MHAKCVVAFNCQKQSNTSKNKQSPSYFCPPDPLATSFKPSFKPPSFKSPPKVAKPAVSGSAGFNLGPSLDGLQFGTSGPGSTGPLGGGANLMGVPFMPGGNLTSEHTATLQNQLALTSNMCQQLLYGQNNLIRAVCERLDRQEPHPMPRVEEHMAMLQQYQMELEAYYHQLCESYAQVITSIDTESG